MPARLVSVAVIGLYSFIMNMPFKIFLSVSFFVLLGACSGPPPKPAAVKVSAADSAVVQNLYKHYNEWRGVRYQEGGLSRQGVDCSGFVYLAYKQKLHKKIPRTTELLMSSGHSIDSSQLRPGDLVFFKTGWKKRHVGIYLQKGKFMHASSSRGVMISELDNPYWSEAFWMARRM